MRRMAKVVARRSRVSGVHPRGDNSDSHHAEGQYRSWEDMVRIVGSVILTARRRSILAPIELSEKAMAERLNWTWLCAKYVS